MPILLSFALLALQDPPANGPATAEPPAPPSIDSDRWLLMWSLQGTYPSWLLDSHRIHILGWTEISFTGSSARASNLPMGFDHLANQFGLQQNWLRVEMPVVTGGTSDPSFGFRADAILPGTDYRFTLARGLFSNQLI